MPSTITTGVPTGALCTKTQQYQRHISSDKSANAPSLMVEGLHGCKGTPFCCCNVGLDALGGQGTRTPYLWSDSSFHSPHVKRDALLPRNNPWAG